MKVPVEPELVHNAPLLLRVQRAEGVELVAEGHDAFVEGCEGHGSGECLGLP
jgi:hypothetical protein